MLETFLTINFLHWLEIYIYIYISEYYITGKDITNNITIKPINMKSIDIT